MASTIPPAPSTAVAPIRRVLRVLIDAVRGALIGIVEVIPGVSGGTVALIVGVYETLIDGAGHLARAAARFVGDGLRGRGLARAGEHARSVRWSVVLPVGIGMVIAVVAGARVIAPLVEDHPIETRAIFAGLIAASLIVPIRMTGRRWRLIDVAIAAAAAAAGFFLMGFPALTPTADPPLLLVGLAAAVAVCALVLPGVSGSYILLALGLYAPTLAAVNDRDLAYIGVFAVGAIAGLGLFVPLLQWLLAHARRITLVLLTGLMAGSLRSVWPWQGEESELLPPAADWGPALALFALGVAIVLALLATEAVLLRRGLMSKPAHADPDADPAS
jgi:putative membrane protein